MFDQLMHARPVGALVLILATILALRAAADLPTMIWLRPRIAGGWTAGVVLGLWAVATLVLGLATHQLLAWLGLLAALVIGLPLSREIADLQAFRIDDPEKGLAKARALRDMLDPGTARAGDRTDTLIDQDVEDDRQASVARANHEVEVATLMAELTGVGRWAYRGHIYRVGAADARVAFMDTDPEEAKPWEGRWRSATAKT
jgi:hypothetical protein